MESDATEVITVKDIENQTVKSLDKLDDGEFLDLFSDTVIEKNPDYKAESLLEEWAGSGITKYEFVVEKFRQVLGVRLREELPIEQQELWIKYTVRAMNELEYSD